jgi:hypothetical protein
LLLDQLLEALRCPASVGFGEVLPVGSGESFESSTACERFVVRLRKSLQGGRMSDMSSMTLRMSATVGWSGSVPVACEFAGSCDGAMS